jgi:hypothetical protein
MEKKLQMKPPAQWFIALFCLLFLVSPVFGAEEDASPDWGKAGQEIKEAAKAVGEATRQTWHIAKKKGAEAWRETKEATAIAVRKTKQKLHEATAPKGSPQQPGPATPPEDSRPGVNEPPPPNREAEPPRQEPQAPVPQEDNSEAGKAKQAI